MICKNWTTLATLNSGGPDKSISSLKRRWKCCRTGHMAKWSYILGCSVSQDPLESVPGETKALIGKIKHDNRIYREYYGWIQNYCLQVVLNQIFKNIWVVGWVRQMRVKSLSGGKASTGEASVIWSQIVDVWSHTTADMASNFNLSLSPCL